MVTHISVMVDEVLEIFEKNIAAEGDFVVVDATLGAGGHSEAILEKFENCTLIGFDQDDMARGMAAEKLSRFDGRFQIVPANFSSMSKDFISDYLPDGASAVSGVLFDLGVSNMQLTTPERGFSYQDEGPLDMRMNADDGGELAFDLLNELDARELTKIFREYGEERYAFQIARGIVRARERGELPDTTAGLTALIRKILPAPVQRKMGTHPSRRIFQALRIAVNHELDVLAEGLEGALDVCGEGGVIVAISYHSLEDRIVKRTFLKWAGEDMGTVLTRKPLLPKESETEKNKSARSAKLRAFRAAKP